MRKPLLLTAFFAATVALGLASHANHTGQPAPAPLPHCQVPCGIYGDTLRIDMMMEDAATIEKGMSSITKIEAEGGASNQLVRWIMNKDHHAAAIQETVASYWLAQRIKRPTADEGRDTYIAQLEHMHAITVAAMKCKQTTDPSHVASLRAHVLQFSGTYFSGDDKKHIHEHHGAEGHEHR